MLVRLEAGQQAAGVLRAMADVVAAEAPLNAAAAVAIDAIPDLELDGTVVSVSPIGEVRRGDVVYTVVIRPDRHGPRLRWYMTATVTVARGDNGD